MFKFISLRDNNSQNYINFVNKFERSIFYHSIKYKKLLEDLFNVKSNYLICKKNDNIEAILPLVKIEGKYGTVINSLPFFGSNGGVISRCPDATCKLIEFYNNMLEDSKATLCSSTIISTPYLNQNISYQYHYIDQRFSQVTDLDSTLINRIEKSALRNIKKAKKNQIEVTIDNSAFEFLYDSYFNSMKDIAWKLKEKKFFKLVEKTLIPEVDYDIYVAKMKNKKIACLLVFYFNKTVEYYIPATIKDFLEFQPLSLILEKAMTQSIKRGYKFWNWGGTWLSQNNVFRFKKKWAAYSIKYNYFTKVFNKDILNCDERSIMNEYPYFYVLPFNQIKS